MLEKKYKNAWEEYKASLKDEKDVTPLDLLSKNNYTTKEIFDNRMSICNDCDRLIKITSQCRECGCFMKMKTRLKNAHCPIGKW